jgi:hypothetical protein
MKDLGKAFTFFFQDPSWITKTLIAAGFMLLSLFGIGIPVLVGYCVQVTQRVMKREQHPLPTWSDVGVQFVTGFKYCVVLFIYALPIILLYIPFIVLVIAGSISGDSDALGMASLLYLFPFMFFVIAYSFVIAAASPIILYSFAERERISDALDLARVFREFKRNWQNTLIVALLTTAIESFAFIGLIAFLVGVFVTVFYAYTAAAYLAGLLYLERPQQVSVA